MSQPKTPPLSVRLPSWLLEHVRTEAAAKGLKVNAELVAVLTRAYRLGEKAADMGATPEQVMKAAKPAAKAAAAAPAAKTPKVASPKPEPFKSRLKGEWTPPGGKATQKGSKT